MCDICSRSKKFQHCPYELLQLLPILKQLWSSISVNFSTKILPVIIFDTIYVIIDQFIKMAYFVLWKKTIFGEEITRHFFDNIHRHQGLRDDIIFYWGPQCISKFWKSFFKILKVNIKLSSIFYPQIDDQTKQVNQFLK